MTTLKIEAGKTYVTRDGRKARVLCTDAKGTQPVFVLRVSLDDEIASRHCADGRYFTSGEDSALDLIAEYREPVTVDVWVNDYGSGVRGVFFSERDAQGAHNISPNIAIHGKLTY